MAASLLADGPVEIIGAPLLRDISTFGKLLGILGAEVTRTGNGDGRDTLRIAPGVADKAEAPYDLVKTMRASVLVLGPLLARYGRARISLPGGCAIGARPIDQHLRGLELLGARTTLSEGYIEATSDRLKGAPVCFDMKTVTGTENLMMAAVLAEGTTVLSNAALEPEVCDLARLLRGMGADIEGEGTDEIVIRGVRSLRGGRHEVMADRIEAATLLLAGAITGGDVTVDGADPSWMGAVLDKLRESGAEVSAVPGGVRVRRTGPIRSVNVKTAPYPGFPTDMQAQFMAYMCLGDGFSIISETIFENRFMHVAELRRMGAKIDVSGNTAAVKGVPKLSGAPLMATDLRASASLVLAGLAAAGTTEVLRIYHLDRGYDALEHKLRSLGAEISRVKE
jgi:UDP-N-acetylglucosamine 1-carboxyvinyltransferase